jgi:putative Mg2+ transporter-C (MgtC) family protein
MIDFTVPEFLQNDPLLDFILRILLSIFCGFCLGLERKIRKHPVGIRTLVFLSLSSCLLGITSITMAKNEIMTGDTTRIAAGVVTGVGFLGAGVIFRQGFNIHGLTTAAIIFTSSALGIACGDGLYIPVFITLAICIIMLTVVESVEHVFFPVEQAKLVKIEFTNKNVNEPEVCALIKGCGLSIVDTDYQYNTLTGEVCLFYKVFKPNIFDYNEFAEKISKLQNVRAFYIGRGDK